MSQSDEEEEEKIRFQGYELRGKRRNLEKLEIENKKLRKENRELKARLEELLGKKRNKKIDLMILYSFPLFITSEIYEFYEKHQYFSHIDFNKEINKIKESLSRIGFGINICAEIGQHETFLENFYQKSPRILHFICHGDYSSHNGVKKYYLALEKNYGTECQPLYSENVKQYLAELKENKIEIGLIFINACYSQQIGNIFIDAGASCVVSVHHSSEIYDDVAIKFSEAFYRYIFAGYTVDASFHMAKLMIKEIFEDNKAKLECVCHIHRPDCKGNKGKSCFKNECCCKEYHEKDGEVFKLQFGNAVKNPKDYRLYDRFKEGALKDLSRKKKWDFGSLKFGDFPDELSACVTINNIQKLLLNRDKLINVFGAQGVGKTSIAAHSLEYFFNRKRGARLNILPCQLEELKNIENYLFQEKKASGMEDFCAKCNGKPEIFFLDNFNLDLEVLRGLIDFFEKCNSKEIIFVFLTEKQFKKEEGEAIKSIEIKPLTEKEAKKLFLKESKFPGLGVPDNAFSPLHLDGYYLRPKNLLKLAEDKKTLEELIRNSSKEEPKIPDALEKDGKARKTFLFLSHFHDGILIKEWEFMQKLGFISNELAVDKYPELWEIKDEFVQLNDKLKQFYTSRDPKDDQGKFKKEMHKSKVFFHIFVATVNKFLPFNSSISNENICISTYLAVSNKGIRETSEVMNSISFFDETNDETIWRDFHILLADDENKLAKFSDDFKEMLKSSESLRRITKSRLKYSLDWLKEIDFSQSGGMSLEYLVYCIRSFVKIYPWLLQTSKLYLKETQRILVLVIEISRKVEGFLKHSSGDPKSIEEIQKIMFLEELNLITLSFHGEALKIDFKENERRIKELRKELETDIFGQSQKEWLKLELDFLEANLYYEKSKKKLQGEKEKEYINEANKLIEQSLTHLNKNRKWDSRFSIFTVLFDMLKGSIYADRIAQEESDETLTNTHVIIDNLLRNSQKLGVSSEPGFEIQINIVLLDIISNYLSEGPNRAIDQRVEIMMAKVMERTKELLKTNKNERISKEFEQTASKIEEKLSEIYNGQFIFMRACPFVSYDQDTGKVEPFNKIMIGRQFRKKSMETFGVTSSTLDFSYKIMSYENILKVFAQGALLVHLNFEQDEGDRVIIEDNFGVKQSVPYRTLFSDIEKNIEKSDIKKKNTIKMLVLCAPEGQKLAAGLGEMLKIPLILYFNCTRKQDPSEFMIQQYFLEEICLEFYKILSKLISKSNIPSSLILNCVQKLESSELFKRASNLFSPEGKLFEIFPNDRKYYQSNEFNDMMRFFQNKIKKIRTSNDRKVLTLRESWSNLPIIQNPIFNLNAEIYKLLNAVVHSDKTPLQINLVGPKATGKTTLARTVGYFLSSRGLVKDSIFYYDLGIWKENNFNKSFHSYLLESIRKEFVKKHGYTKDVLKMCKFKFIFIFDNLEKIRNDKVFCKEFLETIYNNKFSFIIISEEPVTFAEDSITKKEIPIDQFKMSFADQHDDEVLDYLLICNAKRWMTSLKFKNGKLNLQSYIRKRKDKYKERIPDFKKVPIADLEEQYCNLKLSSSKPDDDFFDYIQGDTFFD